MSDLDFGGWFQAADEDHVKREKARARELRSSQWWKNVRGRGRCHYCGIAAAPADLTMDHVVPVIRGGRSSRGNVVPCCKACNDAKQYRLPIEWQEWLKTRREAVKSGTTGHGQSQQPDPGESGQTG